MQRSWADIASDSDDDDHHHPANQGPPPKAEPELELEHYDEEPEPESAPKEYTWPMEPPFTAYVGNLSFGITTNEQMAQGLQDILHERFQASVKIVSARLTIDRHENRPRGFGYVELETVEDLKVVMRLNDGKSMLKGRPLKFDVAERPKQQQSNGSRRSLNRQGSSGGDVDGSQFRGSRFSATRQRDSSSSSLYRQSSLNTESSSTSARQRPSVKLLPRSKSVVGVNESSSSSLFGGGKARDESEWERKRSETERRGSGGAAGGGGGGKQPERHGSSSGGGGGREPQPERRGSSGGAGGGSGRGGGRGRGGGERKNSGRGGSFRGGAGRGGKDEPKKAAPPKENEPAPKKAPPQAQPPVAESVKPVTTKVQNKFSALNMDSDSD